MAETRYTAAVRRVIEHLESTQLLAIEQAAAIVVAALRGGGVIYCAEIGHGTQGDFLNRAGGLAALQPFRQSFHVEDPAPEARRDRPRDEPVERDLEAIRLAVRTSNLRPGDVMLVGSVSGRNRAPVELALACRAAGVHVVGFTSFAYTERVASLHPSGLRLRDAVDVAIDNGAPFGDAAVQIPGIGIDVLPVSGVAMDIAGWMIWERVMERMAREGDPPTVYMSVNREGGQDYYQRAREALNRRGY
ncbi:MAG TPA: sugar isomerase domain-containing protein [Chthonomonadales bacterium]|nr:sugar isomerase domain-containing protein [Chthonomonadales bacterium]